MPFGDFLDCRWVCVFVSENMWRQELCLFVCLFPAELIQSCRWRCFLWDQTNKFATWRLLEKVQYIWFDFYPDKAKKKSLVVGVKTNDLWVCENTEKSGTNCANKEEFSEWGTKQTNRHKRFQAPLAKGKRKKRQNHQTQLFFLFFLIMREGKCLFYVL